MWEPHQKVATPLVAVLLFLFSGTQLRAAIISIAPPTQNAVVGGSVAVDLVVSGLVAGAAPSLGAYDIEVFYDPSILSVVSVTLDNSQLDFSSSGVISTVDLATSGKVGLSVVSLESPSALNSMQAAQFTVATLDFNAAATGISSIIASVNALTDAQGSPLGAEVESGTVTVTSSAPVPEPASFAIWGGICVVALAVRSRRRVAA
jgi:hypothetical protein